MSSECCVNLRVPGLRRGMALPWQRTLPPTDGKMVSLAASKVLIVVDLGSVYIRNDSKHEFELLVIYVTPLQNTIGII